MCTWYDFPSIFFYAERAIRLVSVWVQWHGNWAHDTLINDCQYVRLDAKWTPARNGIRRLIKQQEHNNSLPDDSGAKSNCLQKDFQFSSISNQKSLEHRARGSQRFLCFHIPPGKLKRNQSQIRKTLPIKNWITIIKGTKAYFTSYFLILSAC